MLKRIMNMFVILFSIVFVFILTGCDNQKYIEAEEYTLNAKFEVVDNVVYYESSHGFVAVALKNNDVEEVTLHSSINNVDVYVVASGFLVDNEKVKILNIPNGKMIYETGCVNNCSNLKEINFIYDDYYNLSMEPVLEKKAFDLVDDCYVYIQNVGALEHYVYAYKPLLARTKLLDIVNIRFHADQRVSNFKDYSIKEQSMYMKVEGQMFGLIDIAVVESRNSNSVSRTITLIDDVDFFIKNHKKIKESDFMLDVSGYSCPRKGGFVIAKDYPVSAGGQRRVNDLIGTSVWKHDGKPSLTIEFEASTSYAEPTY